VSIDGKEHQEVRETNDPHVIWKHLVPYDKKWLLTVSTQKGCAYNCKFCDVANLDFCGNLSELQIEQQIRDILLATPYVAKSDKVKIGFTRMGEPALNLTNVLNIIKKLPFLSKSLNRDFRWLPCFNSILPRIVPDVIDQVLEVKENNYNGFLHFQISCNSTDEDQRRKLFGEANVLTIEEIIRKINTYNITNRTITLNFIVMDGIEISISKLKKMGLNKDKFTVKLIPLNKTIKTTYLFFLIH
jgi:23S rRNA (adenine2503-C2)-methyltransferase